ncbi:MAG: peptidyl-tRNA hydrolase [Chloroflexi bacterium]|nr:peptidyl-tRNA hydrolase [Chloroflexota bacterium]
MKAIIGLGNPGPTYRTTRHNVGWFVLDVLAKRWSAGAPVTARHSQVARLVIDGEPVVLVRPQTFMNDSGKAVRALIERDGLGVDEILVICDDLDLAAGRIRVRLSGSAGGHRGILSIQQHLRDLARTTPRIPAAAARLEASLAGDAGARTPSSSPAAAGEGGNPRVAATSLAHGKGGGAMGGISRLLSRVTSRTGNGEPSGAVARSDGTVPFARIKVGIGRPPSGMDAIEFVLGSFTPDDLSLMAGAVDRAADAATDWVREGVRVTMNRHNGTEPGRGASLATVTDTDGRAVGVDRQTLPPHHP